MARREFTKAVYVQIVKRAMHPVHGVFCEGCGLILGKKPYHVDHIKPDGLAIEKSAKLRADDGQLLGLECCHKPKTKVDVTVIAEAKRREEKHLGMKRSKGAIKSPGFRKVEKEHAPSSKSLPPRKLFRSITTRGEIVG
jgi:hypothetical protein